METTKTGWNAAIVRLESDGGIERLIVRVATGRKYWPIFSEPIDRTLGAGDPAIHRMELAVNHRYTHPMRARFRAELEAYLGSIYGARIELTSVK